MRWVDTGMTKRGKGLEDLHGEDDHFWRRVIKGERDPSVIGEMVKARVREGGKKEEGKEKTINGC